jgi:putative effector of murein hydrolase
MSSVLLSFSIIFILSKILGLDDSLVISLYPKSITTPMGYELSMILNGLPAITVFSIVITGITGAVTAPWVLEKANIKSKIAKGIAIGSSSHVLGTSKAFEMGEVEGAMSSLAIALTGLVTVLVVPMLVNLLR